MMKKISVLIFFALVPFLLMAQEDSDENVTSKYIYIGLSGGVDYNINSYQLEPAKWQFDEYYSENPGFNIGLDVGIDIMKKLRPRVELKFAYQSFGFDWDDILDEFDYTLTQLVYMGFGLHLDYRLLASEKLEFYVSPGFKLEGTIYHDDDTYKTDGDNSDAHFSIFEDAYPTSIAAVTGSAIIKYNITDAIGITLTPEYSLYLRNYVRKNDKLYQRFSGNIGVEFRF